MTTTTTLDYDRSAAPTPMIWLHRIALTCALAPMAAGTLTFILYLATREISFAVIGFFTLLAGCAAAFLGSVCLGVYWFQAGRATPDEAAIARRRAKRDALLILANFPLGIGCAIVGVKMLDHETSSLRIVVRNEDAVAPDRVILDTGAQQIDLGSIAPGSANSGRINFGPSGLTATLIRGGQSTPNQIFDQMDSDTIGQGQILYLAVRNGQVVLKN